jgi:hypothetical protein
MAEPLGVVQPLQIGLVRQSLGCGGEAPAAMLSDEVVDDGAGLGDLELAVLDHRRLA